MSRKTQKINFESSIAELEKLVEKMEGGEFSLEESLKQFENGIALARSCQQALREAEQKVFQLTKDEQGSAQLTPFEPSEES
ncbi:MAG: exodeoxyribonuclease VII small subunit [Proteobacteria bacterium]|nr:exodeoxyribonuclease VII small subunit [Pseudomonadota bacterium]